MERVRKFIVKLQPFYLLIALATGFLAGWIMDRGVVPPVIGIIVAIVGIILSYLPFALERKEDGQ